MGKEGAIERERERERALPEREREREREREALFAIASEPAWQVFAENSRLAGLT